jgi:hypothetical protein
MIEFAKTNKDVIKTVSDEQSVIIDSILKLYVPSRQIDVDPTYSKGNFYKKTLIPEPKHKFDLYPQTEDTIQAQKQAIELAKIELEKQQALLKTLTEKYTKIKAKEDKAK